MWKRLALLGIVVVILGAAWSQLFLPALVSEKISQAVKEGGHAETVAVQAESFPALRMLAGRFDRLVIEARGVQLKSLALQSADISLEEAQVDVLRLWRERTPQSLTARRASVRAVIDEGALADLLRQKLKGADGAKVRITPDKVTATSTLSWGKAIRAGVVLEGKVIAANQRIVFVTERFDIDNPHLGKLGGSVSTNLALTDLKDLPLAVRIKKLTQEEGRIVIEADND